MPQETKSKDVEAAQAAGSLAGKAADFFAGVGEGEALAVFEQAFDYRGDVTLTLKDGRVVAGYLFDRKRGSGLADSTVRVMPSDGSANVTVAYADVAGVVFSDRDPAAGKSFESWIKKYVEKKSKGESANIFSEELE